MDFFVCVVVYFIRLSGLGALDVDDFGLAPAGKTIYISFDGQVGELRRAQSTADHRAGARPRILSCSSM